MKQEVEDLPPVHLVKARGMNLEKKIIKYRDNTTKTTYRLGILPPLLLQVIPEEAGFVRNVQAGMEPQARAQPPLVQGEDVMTGEAGDRGHVVQVHDLVSLRLLHGARLGADWLGEPGLQGLLPVHLSLVPLDPLGLITLGLLEVVDPVLPTPEQLLDPDLDLPLQLAVSLGASQPGLAERADQYQERADDLLTSIKSSTSPQHLSKEAGLAGSVKTCCRGVPRVEEDCEYKQRLARQTQQGLALLCKQ